MFEIFCVAGVRPCNAGLTAGTPDDIQSQESRECGGRLLSYAKTAENHAQQIIRSKSAGNAVESLLRQSQFLGK